VRRWPALIAGLGAFALYGATLAPGLTWAHGGADGGDLLAAALTGGVPHPTGYPTYQLALRAAIAVFGGDPARAGAWLSAVCAALAAALLAGLAQRMLAALDDRALKTSEVCQTSEVSRTSEVSYPPLPRVSWPADVASTLAGLTWAAAPTVWGQATITEVYALNALASVALLWLAWRWAEEACSPALWAGGLVLGLGLGNHLTLALVLPGLAAWVWAKRKRAGRAGRDVALACAGALLGLLVYAYLPLAAAGRPPVNWGDPLTPARFLWTVSGRLYAGLSFGLPLADLPARLAGWTAEAMWQFGGPWGALFALGGLWLLQARRRAWWCATLLVFGAFTIYGIGYNTTDSAVYLIPAWATAALWIAVAIDRALRRLPGTAWQAAAAVVLLAALPAASLVRNRATHDLRSDREARDFLSAALEEAEPDSLILASGDRSTFALWYGVYGLHRRSDLAVLSVNLHGYDWYDATFAQTHGDLLPPGTPLEESIGALAAQRPVYRADDLALALPGTVEERTGVLVRLRPVP